MLVRDLLKPTFAPKRLDKREAWEQKSPGGAREWLRDRLDDIRNDSEDEHKKREVPYEEDSGLVLGTPSAMAEFMRLEEERALRQKLRLTLPERQRQVLWSIVEGIPYEEIACRLGIGVSTVKTHAKRLRENPDLRNLLIT